MTPRRSWGAKGQKDRGSAHLALAKLLAHAAGEYDLVLLVCPPGNEPLQAAAVAAARYTLVPLKTDPASRKGVAAVAARMDSVVGLNPALDLLGFVCLTSVARAGASVILGHWDDIGGRSAVKVCTRG